MFDRIEWICFVVGDAAMRMWEDNKDNAHESETFHTVAFVAASIAMHLIVLITVIGMYLYI